MGSILAVAKQTFIQCLRTKIGGLFIILLLISLLATPLLTSNPTVPLADRIRTFLAYSTTVLVVELSVITIFLATGAISNDVSTKQIFILSVKPLARWQYVLGRWLGIVALNAVLLVGAGFTIYAIADWLHGRHELFGPPPSAISDSDRRAVETEVFVARQRIGPDTTGINQAIDAEVSKKLQNARQDGTYKAALNNLMAASGVSEEMAQKSIFDEYRKEITLKRQAASPNMYLRWTFNDVNVSSSGKSGLGEVVAIQKDRGILVVKASTELLGQMVYGGPMRLNGAETRIARIGKDFFIARLSVEDMSRNGIVSLKKGDPVSMEMDPLIQISYKLVPMQTLPDGKSLISIWTIETPSQGSDNYRDQVQQSDASSMLSTLTVSARVVDKDHKTQVTYTNVADPDMPCSVSIPAEDISLLYQVGGFEANFIRGLVLILVQMMFLAAMGIFAGSFLGFSVATILVFGLLPFALLRGFLVDSISSMPPDLAGEITRLIFVILSSLLPNLEGLSPSDRLVGGLHIAFDFESLKPVWWSLVGMGLILAATCVVFRKRELARVQV